MNATPSVTIAIPTLNREKVLCDTISCAIADPYPRKQIAVMDQTKQHEPATEEFLRTLAERGEIDWIRLERPSVTMARNHLVRNCTSDIILFLDDDVSFEPGFVAAHVKAFSLDPKIGCVTGPSPNRGEALVANPDPRMSRPYIGWFFVHFLHTRTGEYPRPLGANMSFRRAVFADVGLFDERIQGPAQYEDPDIGVRVWAAGWKVWYSAEAKLLHLQEKSGGNALRNISTVSSIDLHRNFALYLRQHAPLISWPLAYLYAIHGKAWQPIPGFADRVRCIAKYIAASVRGWREASLALKRPRHAPYP